MIQINGHSLTLADVEAVARNHERVGLAESAHKQVQESRRLVDEIVQQGDPVYAVNTGFGCFSNQQISREETKTLNRNLILTHAVGTGDYFPEDIVRAAMLIRANTLAKGYSGVRLDLILTLIEMLNKDLMPLIPAQGSLGSSGDLAPLSHLALIFTRDEQDLPEESGRALFNSREMSGKEAMEAAGIPRLVLESKEGIAINNGATFCAAVAALSCQDAENLFTNGTYALALSLEALLSVSTAFDDRIHQARQHPGQISLARSIRELTRGSTLLDSTDRIQDAYSLRCSPQVLGPVQETLTFVKQIIEREINAATDNPLLFPGGEALSGGNFHGEPLGLAMDYLGIAFAELSGLSERRTFRLIDKNLNADLPPMLVDQQEQAGLNSGLMMPQYTAAALVLENRSLAAPDSVHSLPTSANQEDHNANSLTAAVHTAQILKNTCRVLAVEIYTAVRALTLRLKQKPDLHPGEGTGKLFQLIREQIPYQGPDGLWGPEIDRIQEMIQDRWFFHQMRK